MKKTSLLLSFILISLAAFSQKKDEEKPTMPYDAEKKIYTYSEVVQLPGTNKDKLYERGIKAIHAMYKQADNKIILNDKENGQLQLKCTTQVILKVGSQDVMFNKIIYKLNLGFKDGKYKYDFVEFHIDEGGFKKSMEKWNMPTQHNPSDRLPEKMEFVDKDIRKLIGMLKENMSSDKVQVKEDW
ncbi:MAG: DUF4468 domain-containing protein [Bacteroidetes bacterium]|nr:DUF4468 domain-containing protein [Bacteroidota bacterium]